MSTAAYALTYTTASTISSLPTSNARACHRWRVRSGRGSVAPMARHDLTAASNWVNRDPPAFRRAPLRFACATSSTASSTSTSAQPELPAPAVARGEVALQRSQVESLRPRGIVHCHRPPSPAVVDAMRSWPSWPSSPSWPCQQLPAL